MVTAHRTTRLVLWLSLVLVGAPGCQDKQAQKKPEADKADSGGVPHAAGVDKNIAEAVAAVAGGNVPGAAQGPPPAGVFAPGAAEHEMRPGEPPKLALGGKGSGPTIQFAAGPPKKKLEGQVEVSVQTGPRSAMPTIDLLLSLEPAAKPAADAPPAPLTVSGRVMASRLAKDQPGQLPPGLEQAIGKARGSLFQIELSPSGAGRVVSVEVAKEFDAELSQVVRSASDVLSVAFLPYPAEPVGVGAFWMVTSRETFAGLDVVAYRMMKLEKIDGSNALVSVNTKRYVAGGQVGFAGLPPHQVVEFNGPTTGHIAVPTSDTAAIQGELSDVVVATLNAQQPQGQAGRLSIHLEIRSRVALAER